MSWFKKIVTLTFFFATNAYSQEDVAGLLETGINTTMDTLQKFFYTCAIAGFTYAIGVIVLGYALKIQAVQAYAEEHKKQMFIATIAAIVMAGMGAVVPLIMKSLVNYKPSF